jgi:hypothetical protein
MSRAVRVKLSDLPAGIRAKLSKRVRIPMTAAQKAINAESKAFRHRLFLQMLTSAKLPHPVAEFVFHPTRKWAFDYCWPDVKVALEIEGGAFIEGRHTRGVGFIRDMQKYSEAAIRGWCLIRVTPDQLQQKSGETSIPHSKLRCRERAIRD